VQKSSLCNKRQVFRSHHKAHGTALISVTSRCETTDTGRYSASRGVPVYASVVVLIAFTNGRMVRLNGAGWLVTYRDDLAVCRRSPIQVLTEPGVTQLHIAR